MKDNKQDLSKLMKKYNFSIKGRKIILLSENKSHNNYVADFLYDLSKNSIRFEGIDIVKSNLEEIFLDLVNS